MRCSRPPPNQIISVEETTSRVWTPAAAAAAAATAPVSTIAVRAPTVAPPPTNSGPPMAVAVTMGVVMGALLPSVAIGLGSEQLGHMRRRRG